MLPRFDMCMSTTASGKMEGGLVLAAFHNSKGCRAATAMRMLLADVY